MWATILKVVLSKMELKHLAILAVVAVFAGLYFQQSKIQELEVEIVKLEKDNSDFEQSNYQLFDTLQRVKQMRESAKVLYERRERWLVDETNKLRRVITEFKTTINNIELKASEIKLQKERLEKQLENLKAKHDYLNHPVPTDIAEWMLQ